MAGTSNVRKPEPLPDIKPEPQKAQAKDAKPAPAEGQHPAGGPPLSPSSESKPIKSGKPPIVLLPPLTPPSFVKHAAGAPKPQPARASSARAEHPNATALDPEDDDEMTSDLVKSAPVHAARPQPGGAPMAPRAALEEMEDEEGSESSDELEADADESADQAEDDAAAQKAKAAARLGKKLRRKALGKERPPADA
jgi:hypothetical protein